jgi:branched-chain amino acid transport system substrate-binding protein
MSLKKLFTCFACVAIAATAVSCKKQNKETVKIGAIFAVTGPASFLGAPEAKTAQMLIDEINSDGGVNGKDLELIVKDSAGKPENAISFAKQLIEENKVFAIVGPSTSGESMKIKSICNDAKVILVSCAAAESIVNPIAPYVFKTPQKDSHAALKILDLMKKKGITKIGVVSSNDGFGAEGKKQLEKLAPAAGVQILISEVYDKKATDLTGVLTKIKAKNVQAVINWSIVPAQSIVAKNMKQLNMSVPLFQSHGFGNIKYVKEAGAAAEGIIFPAGRLLIVDDLLGSHPQKDVLKKYKKDYEGKYSEEVSTFGGHAYDAIMVLVEAMKKGGSDKEKTRAALETLKGFAGTGGVFNYSPTDHTGLDIDAFEMLTVKDGKFVKYEDK